MDHVRSDQELIRREELRQLNTLGINPYPAEQFDVTHHARPIREGFDDQPEQYANVALAGRIMNTRIMGKAAFAELQDSTGSIQLYLKRDELCPDEDKTLYNKVFKKLLGTGDIIGVTGEVFRTETGELSVNVTSLKVLAKALRPMPVRKEKDGEVYAGELADAEARYRMRYVDLVVNPEVRRGFEKRSRLIQSMRQFMVDAGMLEVETPILQPIHGGALARPFVTHHNTLDRDLYLRIANELYLKRLIVGGYDAVFEFARVFRNEGMSRFHNPEFTVMEMYAAYKDYIWMMDFVERMLERVAIVTTGHTTVTVGENEISFKAPFKRITMFDAIKEHTGKDLTGLGEEAIFDIAKGLGLEVDKSMGKGKLIDEIFGEFVEPKLIQPTFITDYPIEMSPLAKKHRDKPGLVERFELICNSKEIANAYTELNDPVDQRERFEEQLALRERGDDEAMVIDEDFLRALEYGMPPTSGLGIGIDRLAMMLMNAPSIQDVLFFPQQRPEAPSGIAPKEDFLALGIPNDWLPLVIKAGIHQPSDLHGKQAGQLAKDLNAWVRKLNLSYDKLENAAVQAWIDAAPAAEDD